MEPLRNDRPETRETRVSFDLPESSGWRARLPAWLTGRRALWGLLGLAPVAVVTTVLLWPSRARIDDQTVYKVRKMDLVVSVLAGGNLTSAGALEIKSQVEGSATIISVIPEGTILTADDVKANRVLMELDSSALNERAVQQDVTVQGSEASFTQARENYEIQKNLNDSNIKNAELKAKFARLDLEKYLGVPVTERLLAGEFTLDNVRALKPPQITELLRRLELGGTARQQWRKLQADIDLAGMKAKQAASTYEWSQKLGPKELGGAGYISGSELESHRLAFQSEQLGEEQAKLALDIFLQYEFPKQAEQLYSDSRETCRNLERVQAQARAQLSSAEASLKSNEATYLLQRDRLTKLKQQIGNCTIRAPRPGMVVYPTTSFWGRGSDKIEEGATVRERQILFTIPDSNSMLVNAKVHETSVNKIKPNQRARIVPDGFPDKEIWGTVQKVAVLADAANPWLSPDLKVYNTTISVENPPLELKPGMSCQVEIVVDTLANVVAVPVQAVNTVNGQRVCYIQKASTCETREVETGEFNDNFIEVVKGLAPGESVLLRTPLSISGTATENGKAGKEAAPKPAAASSKAVEASVATPKADPAAAAATPARKERSKENAAP